MSYRVGHEPLTAGAYAWLSAGADPVARRSPPPHAVSRGELAILIEAAFAHGVLPAMARSLQRFSVEFGPSVIVSDPNASGCVADALRQIDRHLVILAGQSLLLAHHARRIAAAFASDALPACVVKGPVFSQRLYPQPSDRSFTDIDVLIAPAALQASATILKRLGFVLAPRENREGRDDGEYKWLLPGSDVVLVEVQTNLIHSPNLGTGIRLRYADLLAAGGGDPENATALLLLAAVHGAAGHQFERLQPAVDVLQAARGAAGPIDRDRLAHVAAATGATAAVQSALDLAAKLFDETAAQQLADALTATSWRRLRRLVLSPAIVLRSQARKAGCDSWRRRVFREIIRRTGKPVMYADSRARVPIP